MNKPNNFNMNHPEMESDEYWITNVSVFHRPKYSRVNDPSEYRGLKGAIKNMNSICDYTTKRLGNTAYTIDGNELCDHKPVFVKRSEYDYVQAKHEQNH